MFRIICLSIAVFLAGMVGADARSGVNPPAEQRSTPYFAKLPECSAAEVLGFISASFQSSETTYWRSNRIIEGFDRVRQTGMRPWGMDFVPARYCVARAFTSDGKLRHVAYRVRETIGPFGNSWEVVWCVRGFDRHRTYAPGCEQATFWN